jgi:hypothetical protein
LALVVLILGAPLTAGDAGCGFESPDVGLAARSVEFGVAPTAFDFASRSILGSNVLLGNFDLDAARLVLQLDEEDGSEPVRLSLEYVSAVEFRDQDGDGRLGLGDDIVREITLADAAGATLHAIPRLRAQSHEALARYPLNASNLLSGVLEIRFVVSAVPESIAGETRSPERVFIEASVDGFPFQRNDTRLALRVRQQGNADLSAENDEVVSAGEGGRLSYRWSRCVERDQGTGAVGPVVLEYPSGTNPRTTTVFAYPYGETITHATSAGIAKEAVDPDGFDVAQLLPGGNWLTFGAAALGATAAIGATAWRRIRGG